ncbi:hypothetical protein RHS04_02704 [Rhizoctonia solani]|uniref:Uncharacterized protein n=1 Tax=Rhizoctonia solani TaxID=456999 RepID=A0A8H7HBU9_9AGAM|nr:hypothetical protein RHS04_02704 [Rhizoctonia solani]
MTRPHPPDDGSSHQEVSLVSLSASRPEDEIADDDDRLLEAVGRLPDRDSRIRRSSASIPSKLSEESSASSRLELGLGDGVAEKHKRGVGGVDMAAMEHVRVQIEQVGVAHLFTPG